MPITIAVDGYASCGKSTLAKALARELAYTYIDSGAMYRAVTLYLQQNNIPLSDTDKIIQVLPDIRIHFENQEGQNLTFLNGAQVEKAIRSKAVSSAVSQVSTLSAVRRALVAQQRELGTGGGIVMDGRDIGTVVFPQAELKIFMTAAMEVRAQRRLAELKAKGLGNWTLEEVKNNLQQRDHIDSTRADSPLRQAADARVLDNTGLSETQMLQCALDWAQAAIPTP